MSTLTYLKTPFFGLYPNPSLTEPVIPILVMFNPQKKQNMRINPRHAAKRKKTANATDNVEQTDDRREQRSENKQKNHGKSGRVVLSGMVLNDMDFGGCPWEVISWRVGLKLSMTSLREASWDSDPSVITPTQGHLHAVRQPGF